MKNMIDLIKKEKTVSQIFGEIIGSVLGLFIDTFLFQYVWNNVQSTNHINYWVAFVLVMLVGNLVKSVGSNSVKSLKDE